MSKSNLIPLVLLGPRGVGKTTFVTSLLQNEYYGLIHNATMSLFNRDIYVRIFEGDKELGRTRPKSFIIFFDLTIKETVKALKGYLEHAHQAHPMAAIFVLGTHRDVADKRAVDPPDKLLKEIHSYVGASVRYFEVNAKNFSEVQPVFQETVAIPYINETIFISPPEEAEAFAVDAIEWCLESEQFRILAHLLTLGYPIPSESIEKYPEAVGKHLIQLRPLCALPSFRFVSRDSDLYEMAAYGEELVDLEESMQVHDEQSQLELERGWILGWRDLSLFHYPCEMLEAIPKEQLDALVCVDISHNNLSRIPPEILRLPALDTLNVSHNALSRLPHPISWDKGPKVLNASHNSIPNRSDPAMESKVARKELAPRLWYFDLSHNDLTYVPGSILCCPSLLSINLRSNPNLKEVSPSLSLVSSLCHVGVSTDTVHYPPAFIAKQGSAPLLRFLGEQLKEPKPWNRHRLILVGPQNSGKSTLSASLRGDRSHPTRRGLSIENWKCGQSEGIFRRSEINLDVWDFDGDVHLRPVYSSFKCHQSLHLLVFDATRNTSPNTVIQFLAEVQAQSPYQLPALVVVNKMDWVHREDRDSCKQFWRKLFESRVLPEKGVPLPLLPRSLGIHFVSSKAGEGIGGLQSNIFRLLRQLEGQLDPKETFGVGLMVPAYYVAVDEAVHTMRAYHRSPKTKVCFSSMAWITNKIAAIAADLKGTDIKAALELLNEAGVIILSEVEGTTLVSVDPTLLADRITKLIRAAVPKGSGLGKGNSRGSPLMSIDGSQLEEIWSLDKAGMHGVSPSQVFATLKKKRLFVAVNEEQIMVPPFIKIYEGDETPPCFPEADVKRVYEFDYLPQCLLSQLMCVLIADRVGDVPFSFTNTGTSVDLGVRQPFKAGEGQITLWSQSFVYEVGTSGLRVDQVQGSAKVPFYDGQLCFRVWGSLRQQAELLKMACSSLNELLQESFPGLLADHEGFSVSVSVSYNTKSPVVAQEKSTGTVLRHQQCLPYQDVGEGVLHIPLHEVLKQSMHSSKVTILDQTVSLCELIPEYQLQDLPSEILERLEEGQPLHQLQEDSVDGGFFLRKFPSFQQAERDTKKMRLDIRKMLHITECFDKFTKYLKRLHQLRSQFLVGMMGFSLTPPTVKLEHAPCGSLHDVLRSQTLPLPNMDVHTIALQLIGALEFVHSMDVWDLCLHSGNILVWTCKPFSIKLSDKAVPTQPHSCKMCVNVADVPCYDTEFRKKTSVLQLGILIYELATGKRPFQDVHPPSFIITSALHNCLHLSVEAQIQTDHMALQQSSGGGEDEPPSLVTGCQRLCLQTIINDCLSLHNSKRPTLKSIRDRLCLCVGGFKWSPLQMFVSVECLHCAGDPQCVYWVSGSRGLIVGNFNPDTGEVFRHIILEAPVPTSGMFANRKGKPIPLAVGHATCLTVVKATMQLWVGTENGSKGSLHVFDLPDMKNHHSIHLQDAVLSLLAINGSPQADPHHFLCYRVFAGLANGSIIMFSGMHKDRVAQMPLHGARKVIVTKDRGPCLSLVLDLHGRLWYSRGDSVEVMDPLTLQHIAELSSLQVQRPNANLILPSPAGDTASQKPLANQKPPASHSLSVLNKTSHKSQLTRKVTISYKPRPDVIIQLAVSPQGVWCVVRRSTKIFCWDLETGKQRVAYDISSAVEPPIELDEISVLRVHGRGLWVGTRGGFILILDRDKVERGEPPLLGLQKCGEGRVTDICPLLADKQLTACMRVMCSLEHSNETSGLVMVWEYHPHLDGVRLANMRRLPSRQTTASTSSSEGYETHASRTAKTHDSEATKKAEASADDVRFDSHGIQAEGLAGQVGGNHGNSTESVDDSTSDIASVENDAITSRRGDAVPIITGDHNNTTHEIFKNDALTQPPSEAEPHNPFTSTSPRDYTVGSDVIPLVKINTESSEADSLMKIATNGTEQLPTCSDTEPSDLAARKDQPLLPMLEPGEASLVSHRSNCSGSSLEEGPVSGGREEECSLGSWEVVQHLPVQPPGGGACTREGEHNIIEEEGVATLSADGSTPADLAVGEAQEDRTNDPEPCPPHQEFSEPVDTTVVNEAVEPGCRGDAVPIITGDHNNTTHEIAKNDALTQPPSEAEPHNPFTSTSQRDCTVGSDVIPLVKTNTESSEADSVMKIATNGTEQLPTCSDTEPSDLAARKDQPLLPMLEPGEASLVSHRSNCSGSSLEEGPVSGGREEECSLGSWEVVPHLPVQPPGGGACTREGEHNIIEEEGVATLSTDSSTPADLTVGEAQEDRTNDPEPCPPHQEFSEPVDTTVVNEAVEPDMESDSQSDQLDHPSATM